MQTLKQYSSNISSLVARYSATAATSGLKSRYLKQAIVQKLKSWAQYIAAHKTKLAVGSGSLVLLSFAASFIWSPTTHFNFSMAESCASEIILLPNLHRQTTDNGYIVALKDNFNIGNWPLFSRQTCISASQTPKENVSQSISFALFGNAILKQSVKVNTGTYPKLDFKPLVERPISAKKALELHLSDQDAVFEYKFSVNNQSTSCVKKSNLIACPVAELKLEQGKTYSAKLERKFGRESAGYLYEGDVKTGQPVDITATSIANGATTYEPVRELHITTSQTLKNYSQVSMTQKISDSETKQVAHKIEISDKSILVKFDQSLEWRSSYKLSINELQSANQGELKQPFVLEFKTSGGPVVTGSNITKFAVPTNQRLEIHFDQALDPKQDISSKVTLSGAAGNEAVTIVVAGSSLKIKPGRTLPNCATYTLKITSTVANPYGIVGDSSWSRQFRTKCAVVLVIGYSVEGKAIYAHSFGSGASKIVFVGAMHGTERSSKLVLDSWINELEANADRIPAHRTIIVIPNSNPDGTAVTRRTNSHGVDLNRNFPANDWTAGVYMPGPVFAPQGGGSEPLSEPESKALASYIKQTSPRLVLTYHSSAAIVIGNSSGDADSLAGIYASKSRYGVAHDSQADDVFSYTTTGEFEDWLHDKMGIATLLIELASSRSNEFSRNKDAMWHMAGL